MLSIWIWHGVIILCNLPYLLIRYMLHSIRDVIWWVNGTAAAIERHRKNEKGVNCLQVLGIMGRYKVDPGGCSNFLSDFMLYHERFEEPRYLLKPEISLYCITAREFVFVQCWDGESVWDIKKVAFSRVGQYRGANKVLLLPINAAHRLAAELGGRPREKLVFILNTGRCGSTLACQTFQDTGRCVAYSEPSVFNDLFRDYAQPGDAVAEKIIKTAVTLLCKPSLSSSVEAHVIKLQPCATLMAPILYSVFPNCSLIFMYRNIKPTVLSYLKITESPFLNLLVMARAISTRLLSHVIVTHGYHSRHPGLPEVVHSSLGNTGNVACWPLIAIKYYLQIHSRGVVPILAIRYEDLTSRPTETLSRVFEHCRLSKRLVKPALQDFGRDSQASSIIPRVKTRASGRSVIPAKDIAELAFMQQSLGIVDIRMDDSILPGTFLPKKSQRDSKPVSTIPHSVV